MKKNVKKNRCLKTYSGKQMKQKIEDLIIQNFENSKHVVIDDSPDMVAIVKTDYKSMANDTSKEILALFKTEMENII